MFKKEKSGFYKEAQPDIGFDRLPVKYTVPFEWGRFQVTEAAHQAYGLVPLTADFVKGSGDTAADTNNMHPSLPRTNILLVGPQEIIKEGSTVEPFGIQSGVHFTRNGLDLFVGMTQDKDGLGQNGEMIVAKVAELIGINEDQLIHDLTDENGIPFSEVLSHSVPQQIAHVIPGVVGSMLKEVSADWVHSGMDAKAIKIVTWNGIMAVGGTALMLTPEIETSEPITPLRASMAAGFLLSSLIVNRSYIKKYLALRRDSEQVVNLLSEAHAARIAEDIHLTYCAQHFDAKNEELFED